MLAIADLALLSIHCPTATPLSIVHILVGTGQLAWAQLIYRPPGASSPKPQGRAHATLHFALDADIRSPTPSPEKASESAGAGAGEPGCVAGAGATMLAGADCIGVAIAGHAPQPPATPPPADAPAALPMPPNAPPMLPPDAPPHPPPLHTPPPHPPPPHTPPPLAPSPNAATAVPIASKRFVDAPAAHAGFPPADPNAPPPPPQSPPPAPKSSLGGKSAAAPASMGGVWAGGAPPSGSTAAVRGCGCGCCGCCGCCCVAGGGEGASKRSLGAKSAAKGSAVAAAAAPHAAAAAAEGAAEGGGGDGALPATASPKKAVDEPKRSTAADGEAASGTAAGGWSSSVAASPAAAAAGVSLRSPAAPRRRPPHRPQGSYHRRRAAGSGAAPRPACGRSRGRSGTRRKRWGSHRRRRGRSIARGQSTRARAASRRSRTCNRGCARLQPCVRSCNHGCAGCSPVCYRRLQPRVLGALLASGGRRGARVGARVVLVRGREGERRLHEADECGLGGLLLAQLVVRHEARPLAARDGATHLLVAHVLEPIVEVAQPHEEVVLARVGKWARARAVEALGEAAQDLGVVVVALLAVLRAGGEVRVDEAQLGRADAHAHRHAALVARVAAEARLDRVHVQVLDLGRELRSDEDEQQHAHHLLSAHGHVVDTAVLARDGRAEPRLALPPPRHVHVRRLAQQGLGVQVDELLQQATAHMSVLLLLLLPTTTYYTTTTADDLPGSPRRTCPRRRPLPRRGHRRPRAARRAKRAGPHPVTGVAHLIGASLGVKLAIDVPRANEDRQRCVAIGQRRGTPRPLRRRQVGRGAASVHTRRAARGASAHEQRVDADLPRVLEEVLLHVAVGDAHALLDEPRGAAYEALLLVRLREARALAQVGRACVLDRDGVARLLPHAAQHLLGGALDGALQRRVQRHGTRAEEGRQPAAEVV
eukprot:scaffold80708_cov75-Phaeocystis_antarctica.AAC.4